MYLDSIKPKKQGIDPRIPLVVKITFIFFISSNSRPNPSRSPRVSSKILCSHPKPLNFGPLLRWGSLKMSSKFEANPTMESRDIASPSHKTISFPRLIWVSVLTGVNAIVFQKNNCPLILFPFLNRSSPSTIDQLHMLDLVWAHFRSLCSHNNSHPTRVT